MDAFLARLERRFGKLAIEHLPLFIVGGMGLAFVLGSLRPEFLSALQLDIGAVRRGEVWRLVSYLFLPRNDSLIFLAFELYMVWLIGTRLEEEWGAFKLNIYYLLGMVGTTIAAWLSGGSAGNLYLNASMFFAFATLFPDMQFLVMFVVPVKVKWLAWLLAAGILFRAATSPWPVRAAIVAAFVNYLIFFGGTLMAIARGRRLLVKQAAVRESFRPAAPAATEMGTRVCAICAAREDDGADIRVCSCAKCGGTPRNLCLAHAREH